MVVTRRNARGAAPWTRASARSGIRRGPPAWEVLLLAANPLDAVRGVNGHHDLLRRAAERAGGLAVHEQREAQIVDRGKVRDRLARGGLHPAGLAGYQEDEVEPHEEHQAARTRS